MSDTAAICVLVGLAFVVIGWLVDNVLERAHADRTAARAAADRRDDAVRAERTLLIRFVMAKSPGEARVLEQSGADADVKRTDAARSMSMEQYQRMLKEDFETMGLADELAPVLEGL